jgi:hypothetical protein
MLIDKYIQTMYDSILYVTLPCRRTEVEVSADLGVVSLVEGPEHHRKPFLETCVKSCLHRKRDPWCTEFIRHPIQTKHLDLTWSHSKNQELVSGNCVV